jgi:glutaminyl-tRNA synthetase
VRDDLDVVAHRAMAVLDPVKVVIENYPADKVEELSAPRHPKNHDLGERKLFFTKEVYIDRKDFMENPPPDYHRLRPGGRVRLRNAYVITCNSVVKDAQGNVQELRCEYEAGTLGGKPTADGKKVKGIIHWVSATESVDAEVRVYGRLFTVPDPDNVPEGATFKMHLNPDSLKVIRSAKLERSLKEAKKDLRYQFERCGYFCLDSKDSQPDKLVFNMIVELQA